MIDDEHFRVRNPPLFADLPHPIEEISPRKPIHNYNHIGNTTSRRRTRIVSYNRGRLCHDRAFGIAGQTVERTKQCSIAVRRRFPFWDISTGRSTYRHLDLLHHKAN